MTIEPTQDDPSSDAPRERRAGSRLRRLVRGLVVAYLLYVAGFEAAVRTGVAERLANRRPHRFAVSFASAHSWFPFWATVSGVEARGQMPRMRWQMRLDRGSGWLSPLPLVGRRIRLVAAHAEGVELWLRREAVAEPGVAGAPAGAPARAPGSDTELPQIPALAPAPPGPPPTPKWTLEVAGFRAGDVRELRLDQFRLNAAARAQGALTLYLPTRELELGSTTFAFEDGRLAAGEEAVGEELSGSAELSLSRVRYREERGLALLAHISGSMSFAGRISGGRLQRALLPPQEWLALGERPAEFSGELRLAAGELQPGSRVELHQAGYEARAFHFHLKGDVEGGLEVANDEEGPLVTARARFADFEIRRGSAERPDLVGTGLTVTAASRDLQLANLASASATARIELGTARVPDLAAMSDLMPPSAGIELVGGSGSAAGGLDLELPAFSARGGIDCALEGVAVRYGGLDLMGAMRLELALATAHLPGGRFDLAGSRFALTEFKSPQLEGETPLEDPGGWWARIELPEGEIVLPPATAARGQLEIHLRDSVPFVGLFETRKNLPRWVERLLTVRDLRAESGFDYSPRDFTLDEFAMRFRNFGIRARARFGAEHKAGAMMVSWRRLNLGLRFDDERRRFKLVGVRDWYAAQRLDGPVDESSPDTAEALSEEALATVTYSGLPGGPLSPADAEMEAELGAGAEAPAAASPVEIVSGSVARGDLDGDGRDEAVLLLSRSGAAAAAELYLVAVAERGGRPENVATLALGPRPAVGRLHVEAGLVVLEPAPTAAPSEAAEPAPAEVPATLPAPESWRLDGGALIAVPKALANVESEQ